MGTTKLPCSFRPRQLTKNHPPPAPTQFFFALLPPLRDFHLDVAEVYEHPRVPAEVGEVGVFIAGTPVWSQASESDNGRDARDRTTTKRKIF